MLVRSPKRVSARPLATVVGSRLSYRSALLAGGTWKVWQVTQRPDTARSGPWHWRQTCFPGTATSSERALTRTDAWQVRQAELAPLAGLSNPTAVCFR